MSSIEPGDQYVSEDELRSMLGALEGAGALQISRVIA